MAKNEIKKIRNKKTSCESVLLHSPIVNLVYHQQQKL